MQNHKGFTVARREMERGPTSRYWGPGRVNEVNQSWIWRRDLPEFILRLWVNPLIAAIPMNRPLNAGVTRPAAMFYRFKMKTHFQKTKYCGRQITTTEFVSTIMNNRAGFKGIFQHLQCAALLSYQKLDEKIDMNSSNVSKPASRVDTALCVFRSRPTCGICFEAGHPEAHESPLVCILLPVVAFFLLLTLLMLFCLWRRRKGQSVTWHFASCCYCQRCAHSVWYVVCQNMLT